MNIANKNYKKSNDYVFFQISQKIKEYSRKNPNCDIISLGIGDVTRPFSEQLVNVMCEALEKQKYSSTFLGYPPEQGYDFLREKICSKYKKFNIELNKEEIFIGNGIGCDITNILDIFCNYTPLIIEPTYPAYKKSNLFLGKKPLIKTATPKNNFCVLPKNIPFKQYIIYICSPNNPTGYTYTKPQLKQWVDFANKTKSIILFDGAYECFVENDYPHSIFEIGGAKKCAIEFCSFSKMSGFTNLRCSYTVIPKKLCRDGVNLNKSFLCRQVTKFNGVPYFVQQGACYALSEQGEKEQKKNIEYYKNNVKIIVQYISQLNFEFTYSSNSPYVWLKCPNSKNSWQFFDEILQNCQVVCTPGIGFGKCGHEYIRLSGFNSQENTIKACERIYDFYKEKSTTV